MADDTGVSSTPAESVSTLAPETAADQFVASGDVAGYKAARLAERAGAIAPSTLADSSPAVPAAQAAPTGASPEPASEPGTPRKKGAESRIEELLRERKADRERADRLERELSDLRTRVPPQPDVTRAAPSPAPADVEPTLAAFEADPDKYPDPYAAYVKAQARWEAREEFRAQQRQAREEAAQQHAVTEQQTQVETFAKRVAEAKAADPDFLTKISPDLLNITPRAPQEPATPLNTLGEAILTSAVGPQVMRYLTDHADELRALLDQPERALLLRAFGRLEAKLTTDDTPAAPVKTITSAPAPQNVLGHKPGSPANELEGAVRSGDVAEYKALRYKQWAASGRR